MNRSEKNIKLAETLAKKALGIESDKARQKFDDWLSEDSEHIKIYENIISDDKQKEREDLLSQIDVKSAWDNIGIEEKQKYQIINPRIKQLFKYAAVLVLFVSASVFFLNKSRDKSTNSKLVAEKTDVKPNKVRLILSDGSSKNLSDNNAKIVDVKGVEIKTNNNTISYNKKGSSEGTKIYYNTIVTEKGGDYNLILADGTKVWLNQNSQLKYPVEFNSKNRKVFLKGEAFFEVAHNKKKPFFVNIKYSVDVKVLGTSFNIKADSSDDFIATTLVEGSVKLLKGDKDLGNLKPGYQATIKNNSDKPVIKKVDVENYIAWKDGLFYFKDKRLADIMVSLNNWYDIKVEYITDDVKDIKFTGYFKTKEESVVPIIKMLRNTDKVNIAYSNNTMFISKK